MLVKFHKMHGLGNDFMVIDAINQDLSLNAAKIRELSDRHTGVGFDQLLLVEPSTRSGCAINYRIFNADGGEVEQCGNGARCVARFCIDQGLVEQNKFKAETKNGQIELELTADDQVRVNMGCPDFNLAAIPMQAEAMVDKYLFETELGPQTIGAVSMGNPHCVQLCESIEQAPVEAVGQVLTKDPHFPQGVNVGFMQIVDPKQIKLRVYERGVGETMACGSGACAAVAIGIKWQLLEQEVLCNLPGGQLSIIWEGNNTDLYMKGPANYVYKGDLGL